MSETSLCRICLEPIVYVGGYVLTAATRERHGCDPQPDRAPATSTLWGEPALAVATTPEDVSDLEPGAEDAFAEITEEEILAGELEADPVTTGVQPDSEPEPTAEEEEAAIAASSEPEKKQLSMFDVKDFSETKREWKGMPEFIQKDLSPARSILVHFETLEHWSAFAKLVGQKLTKQTRSIWYPQADISRYVNKRYIAMEEELLASIELEECADES